MIQNWSYLEMSWVPKLIVPKKRLKRFWQNFVLYHLKTGEDHYSIPHIQEIFISWVIIGLLRANLILSKIVYNNFDWILCPTVFGLEKTIGLIHMFEKIRLMNHFGVTVGKFYLSLSKKWFKRFYVNFVFYRFKLPENHWTNSKSSNRFD